MSAATATPPIIMRRKPLIFRKSSAGAPVPTEQKGTVEQTVAHMLATPGFAVPTFWSTCACATEISEPMSERSACMLEIHGKESVHKSMSGIGDDGAGKRPPNDTEAFLVFIAFAAGNGHAVPGKHDGKDEHNVEESDNDANDGRQCAATEEVLRKALAVIFRHDEGDDHLRCQRHHESDERIDDRPLGTRDFRLIAECQHHLHAGDGNEDNGGRTGDIAEDANERRKCACEEDIVERSSPPRQSRAD